MKKRNIIICTASILLILGFISILVFGSKDNTFTENGITYALIVDGVKQNDFPSKGLYRVDTECTNAICKWDYDAWELVVSDNADGDVSCNITFTTITKNYLNDYIIGLVGTIQGNGQLVHETFTRRIDNSTLTNAIKLEQNNYSNLTNDTTYEWNWDETNKVWTSSNKGDNAKSTTSTIVFNPSENGTYQICYKQSSEVNYDFGRLFKNNSEILSLKGKNVSSYECMFLKNLTVTDQIKVTYKKDGSGNSGDDEVSFYLQGGTYNENITIKNIDTGYRYEGQDPNNYVWFNNELWRVIGVMNEESHGLTNTNLVKIIRNEPIGGFVWHKLYNNDWNTSSLKALLNTEYLNSTNGTDGDNCWGSTNTNGNPSAKPKCNYTINGLKKYQKMIKEVTWYLGGWSTTAVTTEAMYGYERDATSKYSSNLASISAKVGLMYASDYGYAVPAVSCTRSTDLGSFSNNANCTLNNWLHGNGNKWTITPSNSNISDVFEVDVRGDIWKPNVMASAAAHPVLYLESGVYVLDGDGSITDPYIIGMDET